jgi:hypothetical protein
MGEDCSRAAPCLDDCSQHGACAGGTCFCDPGWAGPSCAAPAGCPASCSGHGACVHGTCFCDDEYSGHDCSVPPPPHTHKLELRPAALVVISCASLVLGLVAGLGLKVVSDARRRAQLIRLIQDSDAQAPFVSGDLRNIVSE